MTDINTALDLLTQTSHMSDHMQVHPHSLSWTHLYVYSHWELWRLCS